MKETALRFVTYLNENRLTPKLWRQEWAKDNFTWKIPYSECNLCMIQIGPNKWKFTFFFGDYSGQFDERFIITVQEHVQICKSRHDGCMFGKDTRIFGKIYINACSQLTIQFETPNDKTLEDIKKLIEYSKKIAPDSVSWHCHN